MKFFTRVFFFCLCPVLWAQSEITEIGELPLAVRETSGLIHYNNNLITHNDSGNLPELYEIDKNTLEITRVVTVANAINTDWEDITQDEDYIYIGDIGNNNGNRTDLKILKISKSDYDTSDTVTAEIISYAYEDQTSFISQTNNNDFDAEALLVIDDNLIVFTKQWVSLGTVAYSIPKLAGEHIAVNIGSYQVEGLITGGTQNQADANVFYLVGYSEILFPFFVQFNFQDNTSIFSGEISTFLLNIGVAQVESIAFNIEENEFFISSEEFISPPIIDTKARLFSFSLDDNEEEEEENENGEGEEEPSTIEEDVILVKSFAEAEIQFILKENLNLLSLAIFDASGRLLLLEENIEDSILPTDILSSGVYYATFIFEDRRISKAFLKE